MYLYIMYIVEFFEPFLFFLLRAFVVFLFFSTSVAQVVRCGVGMGTGRFSVSCEVCIG